MTDQITVTGIVGSDPRPFTTSQGLVITTFRLASTRRYFDRERNAWADGETNWYTVSAFRNLAGNAAMSLRKGEHVIVHGRLKQRAWEAGERSGTAVEIEADAIGHDLTWGVTRLQRLTSPRSDDPAAASGDAEPTSASETQDGAVHDLGAFGDSDSVEESGWGSPVETQAGGLGASDGLRDSDASEPEFAVSAS